MNRRRLSVHAFPPFLRVLAILPALSLAGCLTLGGADPELAAGPPPVYGIGDSFRFTGGRVETVAGVDGNSILWSDGRGGSERRDRNFIVAGTQWTARPSLQVGRTEGPHTLWPLQIGRSAEFSTPAADGESQWRCFVTGTLTESVPAGTFDVFRIRCVHGYAPGAVDERLWYFAPAVGHYVVTLTKRDGKVVRRHDLIAADPGAQRLSDAGRRAMEGLLQQSIEKDLSGHARTVPAAPGSPAVAVMPTATFRNRDGGYCRTYVTRLLGPAVERRYPGLACRGNDGIWRVPEG